MVTEQPTHGTAQAKRPRSAFRSRLFATLGNLLMCTGVYLLLYVGGLYIQIDYQRLAARGDNDLAVPHTVIQRPDAINAPRVTIGASTNSAPLSYVAPVLSDGQIASALPDLTAVQGATVERLIIPVIELDAKVIEVGWQTVEQNGQQAAVWNVAEYAVGQHQGSANPGQGENIVLAGHVGGYGQVFRDLYYVKPGNRVMLYSAGQEYLYIVTERLIVDEDHAPPEQRAANAQLISPTGSEMVTMVACWPLTGKSKYTQRVIIRAAPYGAQLAAPLDAPPAATIR